MIVEHAYPYYQYRCTLHHTLAEDTDTALLYTSQTTTTRVCTQIFASSRCGHSALISSRMKSGSAMM